MNSEASTKTPRSIVDTALQRHGDLGPYGDLSAGLDEVEKLFSVEINAGADRIQVYLAPLSEEGHDFSFDVITATGEISGVVVGQLEPQPEY